MVYGDEMMQLLREHLDRGQKVRYLPFRGVSMLPMLRQGTDSVELAPVTATLKKYDLPVYRYPNGKYVMHRIVEVRGDSYICLGDNTYEYETIDPAWVVGVVSAFKRGERRIEADAWQYRVYSRVWVALFPLRRLARRGKHYVCGLLKRN